MIRTLLSVLVFVGMAIPTSLIAASATQEVLLSDSTFKLADPEDFASERTLDTTASVVSYSYDSTGQAQAKIWVSNVKGVVTVNRGSWIYNSDGKISSYVIDTNTNADTTQGIWQTKETHLYGYDTLGAKSYDSCFTALGTPNSAYIYSYAAARDTGWSLYLSDIDTNGVLDSSSQTVTVYQDSVHATTATTAIFFMGSQFPVSSTKYSYREVAGSLRYDTIVIFSNIANSGSIIVYDYDTSGNCIGEYVRSYNSNPTTATAPVAGKYIVHTYGVPGNSVAIATPSTANVVMDKAFSVQCVGRTLKSVSGIKSVEVQVFSPSGRSIAQGTLPMNIVGAPGTYFVKFATPSGFVQRKVLLP